MVPSKPTVRFGPLTVALCLGTLLLDACRKEEPQRSDQAPQPTATPRSVGPDLIQQQLNAMAEAMPADLQVGSGDDAITVRRHWRGDDTRQRKFGTGWGDDNVVQLVQFDRDAVLIYRGGTGWRLAHRDGNNFKTTGGEPVERGPNGWTYLSNDKTRFEFDETGRLRKETTASNQVRNYAYDGSGKLDRVTNTRSENIQYKYDTAGLVAAVQGSNNKSTTYLYENGKLSEAKNKDGGTRSYRYQYDTAGAVIAQVRIIGAAPAASAEAQTIAVGVETVVAPIAPTAASAALSNLVRATGVIGTSALTAIAVTYAGIEAKGWANAKTEAGAAQATAKNLKTALENKLAEVLKNDPTKLLPFPDGHKPDPKNPDDLEQLLIELHSNLTKEKKPFEGIVVTSPDPSDLEAALAKARQIRDEIVKLAKEADPLSRRAADLDREAGPEAMKVTALWSSKMRDGLLKEFQEELQNVKRSTAEVQTAAQRLAALQAELSAAIAGAEAAAAGACAVAAAPPSSAAEATAQQKKFEASLKEAVTQVAAAKEKIKTADVVTGDTLRFQLAELLTDADQLRGAAEVVRSKDWKDVVESLREKAKERDAVEAKAKTTRDQIKAKQSAIDTVLAPFRTHPEAISLLAYVTAYLSADPTLEAPWTSVNGWLAVLASCEKRSREAEKATAEIEVLRKAANETIEQVVKAQDAAVALTGDTRSDQALTRANACLARIQVAAAAPPNASPTVDPLSAASGDVVVPDLSAFQNVTEMKAVLAHAELKAQLIAAKEKPPSKDKEFKFAGQAPGPGTKVQRGSTVSIAFYQKFEGATESAANSPVIEGDWFSGRWTGTLVGAESKETKTFEIRKQGEGYVFGAPGVKETFPLRLEGGALVAEYKFTMGADVGISIGGKKATAKGTPEHFTLRYVLAPAGSALSVTITTTNDKTGKTEGTVKGILNRQ